MASLATTIDAPTLAAPPAGATKAWADRAIVVTALISAVMRIASASPGEWWLPPIIGITAIHGLVVVLFCLSRPVVLFGSLTQFVSCLPTMIGLGLALRFAPPLGEWPWPAHVLFAAGVAITLVAFISLGRSFGVLPALRKTIVRGPYGWIRHPAYAGELLMAVACLAAGPSLLALAAWLLLLPGVVWRILSEESVLAGDESYIAYQTAVRWRLLPGVW